MNKKATSLTQGLLDLKGEILYKLSSLYDVTNW